MKKAVLTLVYLTFLSLSSGAQEFFLEAETFKDKGGWSVDQQFIDQMGSSYLIAHGIGVPVPDAVTPISVSEGGVYHVYVRTFNWTSPWCETDGAGAFTVKINGKKLKNVLGVTGTAWEWQYAGETKLKKGENTVALSDLKGFDGRCDAVWITPDRNSVPPTCVKELDAFRRRVGAITTVREKDAEKSEAKRS